MREIKFRGIDCSGQWVYGDLIHKRHDKESVLIQDYKGLGSDVDIITIGQYTGLKDKYGKEIYEGDVVKLDWVSANYIGSNSIPYKMTCVCIYIETQSRFAYKRISHNSKKLSRNWGYKGMGSFEISNIEIIGNIHDNPELIKEEEK